MYYYQVGRMLEKDVLERALSNFLNRWFLGRKAEESFQEYLSICALLNQKDYSLNGSGVQGAVAMTVSFSPSRTTLSWEGQFSPDRSLEICWEEEEEGWWEPRYHVRASLAWDKPIQLSKFFLESGLSLLPWRPFAEGFDLRLVTPVPAYPGVVDFLEKHNGKFVFGVQADSLKHAQVRANGTTGDRLLQIYSGREGKWYNVPGNIWELMQ